MARLELAKTWHRHRCRRGLRWLWHQDPNAEPFPALSRKGDMPRSFLVPLGARMPDSSVPPSECTAPGTAQSRTGPRRATADQVDRADARRLAGQEDHRTGLFRHHWRRPRRTTPWNSTGPAANSAPKAPADGHLPFQTACASSAPSSWKQPGARWATRANRSSDAPIPRPTSLKRAHRQASTLEPAW